MSYRDGYVGQISPQENELLQTVAGHQRRILVDIGIDSMSLNPDTVIKTTLHALEVEKRLKHQPREEEGSD